jgi:hypothetical protein
MQKLELLFLLAVTLSLAVSIPSTLAQETSTNMTEDEMEGEMTETSEEMVDDTDEMMEDADEMMEDEMTDEMMDDADEMMEDEMIDEMMEDEAVMAEEPMAPLKQLIAGVDPHEIQCKTGQKLVFKASNFRSVCIKESSYDVLLAWGWVSSHDPTHEELAKMTSDIMASQPQMEETDDAMMEETEMMDDSMESEDDASLEEELAMEEETSSDDEPDLEAQNFTINLSESMSMGAQ